MPVQSHHASQPPSLAGDTSAKPTVNAACRGGSTSCASTSFPRRGCGLAGVRTWDTRDGRRVDRVARWMSSCREAAGPAGRSPRCFSRSHPFVKGASWSLLCAAEWPRGGASWSSGREASAPARTAQCWAGRPPVRVGAGRDSGGAALGHRAAHQGGPPRHRCASW